MRTLLLFGLISLSFSFRGLATLDRVKNNDPSFTSLALMDYQIESYADALKDNTHVRELTMGSEFSDDNDMIILSEVLKENIGIKKILIITRAKSLGWAAFGQALKINTSLEELKISAVHLGDIELSLFSLGLVENESLKVLFFLDVSKKLTSEGIYAISKALEEHPMLTVLFMNKANIEDEGATHLAKLLKVNAIITTLYLWGNQIGNEGAIALAEALKVNTSLTTLNLEYNQINNKGAIELGWMMMENKSLAFLSLYAQEPRMTREAREFLNRVRELNPAIKFEH